MARKATNQNFAMTLYDVFRRRLAFKAATALVSLAIGLGLAEIVVRASNADWRYVRKNLAYCGHVDYLTPDPDPEIVYRLKPDSGALEKGPFGRITVTINRFGERGPERREPRAAGVFRIACVGGSNVFGQALSDRETWPAQLEDRLNALGGARFEVWNFGTPGYKGVQMAKIARETLERHSPDVILVGLSNQGPVHFFQDAPIASYFARRPDFWRRLVSTRVFAFPGWLAPARKIALLAHVRAYRLAAMAISQGLNRTRHDPLWHWGDGDGVERENADRICEFLHDAAGRTRCGVFVGPYVPLPQRDMFADYYEGTGTPIYYLDATDKPAEYAWIHPSPQVAGWCADNIAEWLVRERLVPGGKR